ncbi:MAG TPA: SulP family inorganic anion transporter [Actinomycetota bacterium]|nr:SulP family inorganic anion transporter [Actinomycetota bacterium]
MTTESIAAEPGGGRPIPPKDWLAGLKENLQTDIVSGLIIFLIALPLCLGIALASGAPPISGVITGIVAGTLANLFSGSYVTINGPAAGMIVIVLGAVTELGFRGALAVGVVTGFIQIGLGLARTGKLTGFFPLSVVHGMLAGIGLIIMSGQIHIVVGHANPREHGFHILTAIPHSVFDPVVETAIVGVAAILVMVLWPRLGKVARVIPAPLAAVVIGTVIAIINGAGPRLDLQGGLLQGFQTPDFSAVLTGPGLKWVALYVFVASLESLLTAEAVDKLDPWKRRSDMNRELIGKGIGNAVSSAIGGLPMIAEVVRSKANIMAGARTRWSNFFHGVFLFLFVLAVPGLLELIPLAALAGILMVVGFRLAHPADFKHAWDIGKVDFALMTITAFTVLLTDLLIGVATGIVLGILHALFRSTSVANLFKPRMEVTDDGSKVTLRFRGGLGFHNFIPVRGVLDNMPRGREVTLDFTQVHYVDPTVLERLHDFEVDYAYDGGTVTHVGESLKPGPHPFSTRTAPKVTV